jgi:predicted MFS family arabinose efflux permease
MSTASVASLAVGGVLGDLLGVRSVFLVAGGFVLAAAAVSWVMFRGASVPSKASVQAAESA